MREIFLGSKKINEDSEPYIIAEIGVNHENSLQKAFELIDLAKEGGADAVKFQTYKAEKIASINSPSYWDLNEVPTETQYKLFKKYDHFNPEDYGKLYKYATEKKIEFISTCFDLDAVDFLDPMMNFYKIASADITNYPLLRKIASKKKPVILSTGASTTLEISNACIELKNNGVNFISLLHCILNYPTKEEDANLNMIKFLANNFPNYIIGLSDHSYPDKNMNICSMSYVIGARIIEKHFTYDKSLKDNDHFHSMDINDLKILKKNCLESKKILGMHTKKILESEKISNKNARRSIVIKKKVLKNDTLTNDMLICKRPGTGISPSNIDRIIGRKAIKDLDEDHILDWLDISDQ
jgi:N-acetylneuraminate synthase